MKNISLSLLLIILVGCSSPSKRAVQRSFLQDHPGCTLVGITKVVNRGGMPKTDEFVFTITYKKPSDRATYEDHYTYLRDTDIEIDGKKP